MGRALRARPARATERAGHPQEHPASAANRREGTPAPSDDKVSQSHPADPVILSKNPSLRPVFRGYGNDRAYEALLHRTASQSPAADSIHFQAYEPVASVADIYHGADAVILLSQYEGFGLPVLEAQQLGIPVICSDLPVLREVAGDGAIFVSPDDPDAVAAAIHRLMTAPDHYRDMAERGRRNAAKFSWDQAAQQTVAVYQAAGD